jgi:hypothetical protein
MSAAAKPWMKFYPQDWRADEKLRLCSLAARGLWMEMLAIMHRSERYGQLLIGGQVPTEAQLAVQVGASTPEVSELLGQLEAAGVFSRAASGAIYSRRMTRDHKKAQIARKNGKTGGNPKLRKQMENPPLDKGADKGGLKPQRPEARSSDTKVSGETPPDPVKELFDLGVSVLMSSGHTEREARSLTGKWKRDYGDGPTAAALVECRTRSIANPVEWIPKRLGSERQSTGYDRGFIRRKYQTAAAG